MPAWKLVCLYEHVHAHYTCIDMILFLIQTPQNKDQQHQKQPSYPQAPQLEPNCTWDKYKKGIAPEN